MSEHQITVEQIVSIISFHTSNSEVLIEKHKNEFRRVINEFAREQRADATRELQREIADARKWMREALSKCAAYGSELAAAKQQLKDAEQKALTASLSMMQQLEAAKQQLADYRYSYADTLVTMQLMREEIELTSKNFREFQQSINNDTIVISVSEVRDTEIGAAVNRACKELPEGYVIVICLEKDAGDIELQCPDHQFTRSDFEHEADTFGGQINAAIDAAIAIQGAEVKS